MELSSSSYQRQLVAEKKKTVTAQEEIRTLQEEVERLTNKLKVHRHKTSAGRNNIILHKKIIIFYFCSFAIRRRRESLMLRTFMLTAW